MLDKGQVTWSYSVDENSNINEMTYHSSRTTLEINANNQVETAADTSYIYDEDGFLVQRGAEVFEYNSMNRLVRAFEPNVYDVRYHYDGLNRLVARYAHDELTQYLYTDIQRPQRLTEVYEGAELTRLLYDDAGERLVGFRRGDRDYYVALDTAHSPIAVFNSIGSVVWQTVYSPLGAPLDPPDRFHFPLGFGGGVHDPDTGLVFLRGRCYDPHTGRWTAPDYQQFLAELDQVFEEPEKCNHYVYRAVTRKVNGMTGQYHPPPSPRAFSLQ